MRLRLIPAGEFVMGSPGDESGRFSNEGPQRTVRITKPFYMGIHEVTQAQCQAVMGSNPSHLKGNDLPVECVSWNDAMEFCRRLSEQTGLTFGLPTEAQWEYACRAGATTTYCFSGNAAQLKDYAWYLDDSGRKTHPVGQKRPNAFGLYDMHGNVLEWCLDSYKDRYTRLPNRDPQYEQQGATHVLRGGSYDLTEGHCRSAYRDSQNPVVAYLSSGFRVVVVLQGKAKPDKQTSWDKGMSSITQKSYEKRRI
ncbi:MAG: formylglycine-generating enzyme family protein [Phycisphaerae bacterium]|nr:formylglycine-generating enzyme family protein [Phycisphaerae bacterium]